MSEQIPTTGAFQFIILNLSMLIPETVAYPCNPLNTSLQTAIIVFDNPASLNI